MELDSGSEKDRRLRYKITVLNKPKEGVSMFTPIVTFKIIIITNVRT